VPEDDIAHLLNETGQQLRRLCAVSAFDGEQLLLVLPDQSFHPRDSEFVNNIAHNILGASHLISEFYAPFAHGGLPPSVAGGNVSFDVSFLCAVLDSQRRSDRALQDIVGKRRSWAAEAAKQSRKSYLPTLPFSQGAGEFFPSLGHFPQFGAMLWIPDAAGELPTLLRFFQRLFRTEFR
jgi:hypothetical protein